MSHVDHTSYALTKTIMCGMGIWPEQSKYVRIILPSTVVTLLLTLFGPALIRLRDAWRDIAVLTRTTTISLMGIGIVFSMLHTIQHVDTIRLLIKKTEKHWEMFKNTPAVIVLDKYAERGRYIIVVYTSCVKMERT